MRKEEIKKDVIYEKIIGFINHINDNQKQTGLTLLSVFSILVVIVLFMNRSESEKLANNAYSSTYQNNYIDNNKELALIGFENILNEGSSSESYNQAFLYTLSDAIENNELDKVSSIINDNNFDTDDDMLNSMYYKLSADYYVLLDQLDEAISSYNKAIKYSNNDDYTNKYKISLASLYIHIEKYSKAKSITQEMNIDDLSYDNRNKFEDITSRLKYITN